MFSNPAVLQAWLNWYVAADEHMRLLNDGSFKVGPVDTPTLRWGKTDVYIRRMALDLAEPYMLGPYRVVEVDAGHSLIRSKPSRCGTKS